MKTRLTFATVVICIIVLVSCSGADKPAAGGEHVHDAAQAGHTHEGDAESEPAGGEKEHQHLDVTKEKQKTWGIQVGRVHKESLTARVSLPGVLALNQNRTAHVSAFVHGQISELSVDLGRRVRKDQPLLTLISPDFAELQADFLQARAAYNLSRTEYQRAESLWEARAIEEKEYLRRRAEHEKLSTAYGALGSKLHSLGLTHDQIDQLIEKCRLVEEQEYKCEVADPHLPLLAPISGTVIFRDAVKGAHIEPETILFTISDLGTLWAHLDVYEKDIPLVSKQSRIQIQTSLYPDKAFPARITYVSNLIDERLRTMKVRVEVDNPQGLLKPNMYIQGLLESEILEGEKVLALPEEAVQNLNGEKIVFVREASEVFAVRHVRIGEQVGDNRIILAGLTENENVVLKGAFTLKTELSKGTFGHSHVH
jgi:cobalt-zinc-cadmium efflux system membrane fusion protein